MDKLKIFNNFLKTYVHIGEISSLDSIMDQELFDSIKKSIEEKFNENVFEFVALPSEHLDNYWSLFLAYDSKKHYVEESEDELKEKFVYMLQEMYGNMRKD